MSLDSLIPRINELAAKKKNQGLTKEEIEEQARLRKEYIKQFRNQFTAVLDNTDIYNEVVVDTKEITNTKLEVMKNYDSIVKIELKNNEYIITYDIKKITEEEILKLISS